MEKNKIFYSKKHDEEMLQAFQQAQNTFKYFWRELFWESHRIVGALSIAVVKIAFIEETDDEMNPLVEHMWVNQIEFDGDYISGVLVNKPNVIGNVKNGDTIKVPLHQLSDWLFVIGNQTYGGFTIQLIRSRMNEQERSEHDKAWGIPFGDFNDILIAYQQKEYPENLIEHPMSVNMREKIAIFLKENPLEVNGSDEMGYTHLHREAIAGNKTSIEEFLKAGANPNAKTLTGKTPLDFAKQLDWKHIIPLLSN
jgi:uncharacterized protein YegJ (DUF2314 family)